MKREFLKSLGIEDGDVIDKILDENGEDMKRERNKFADYDTIKNDLKEANKKLKEFEDADIASITKERDDYKEKFENLEKSSEKSLNDLKFDYAVKEALKASKAKNDTAVKALLDMDKISYKDGEISGLSEQLDKLKTEHEYLFEQGNNGTPSFSGKTSGGGAELTKEAFSRMSYRERIKLKQENPETYGALAGKSE